MSAAVVVALATTPVKALRMVARPAVMLERSGVPDDHRFHLVDDRGRMINAKHLPALCTVAASYDGGELTLTFPGGDVVSGRAELGEAFGTRFYSRPAAARPVLGPWSQALSEHAGRPLRLVALEGRSAVDRGRSGAVSLISRGSLSELARVAGADAIDARRFRMLVEIDGVAPHAEDAWVGVRVRIGAAVVRFGGHVGRCSITSLDPQTGRSDLPTLDLLRSYRGDLDTTEPLPFGIYGAVVEPGLVSVGDAVQLA